MNHQIIFTKDYVYICGNYWILYDVISDLKQELNMVRVTLRAHADSDNQ